MNANIAGALATLNLTQTGGAVTQSVANAFQGPIALNLSGGTTTLNFANSYTGGANISGTNVTTISAAGALSGTTTVSGGGTLSSSLASNAAGTPNNSGGTIFVNSGGILTSAVAGGSFTNVNVNSGGIVNPGGVGVVGTAPLTLNGFATSSGALLQFDIASTTSYDSLLVGNLSGLGVGSNSFGAGTTIVPLSFGQLSTTLGTYNLINYGSNTAPALANFNTSTAPSGLTYTVGESGGFVTLAISGTYNPVNATAGSWLPTGAATFSWNTQRRIGTTAWRPTSAAIPPTLIPRSPALKPSPLMARSMSAR